MKQGQIKPLSKYFNKKKNCIYNLLLNKEKQLNLQQLIFKFIKFIDW